MNCLWIGMVILSMGCRLTTLLDVPRTLEFLAYLGYHFYHDSQLSAVHGQWEGRCWRMWVVCGPLCVKHIYFWTVVQCFSFLLFFECIFKVKEGKKKILQAYIFLSLPFFQYCTTTSFLLFHFFKFVDCLFSFIFYFQWLETRRLTWKSAKLPEMSSAAMF